MRTTCCAGRQALEDLLIDGAIAHPIDERLDDLEVDVRFEQRHPDLAKRRLDGRFRQPDFAAQGAENALQAVAERFEHVVTPAGAPCLRRDAMAPKSFRRKRLS